MARACHKTPIIQNFYMKNHEWLGKDVVKISKNVDIEEVFDFEVNRRRLELLKKEVAEIEAKIAEYEKLNDRPMEEPKIEGII